MAPAKQNMKDKGKFARNGGKESHANRRPGGVNKQKRKWVPDYRKPFEGSVGEGQGFAFMRKQKVQHQYNKLQTKLRKERARNPAVKTAYSNDYPEHLRHLYAAEAEKLREDIWENRKKRFEGRMGALAGREETEDPSENDAPADPQVPTDTGAEPGISTVTEPGIATVTEPGVIAEQTGPAAADGPTLAAVPHSLPMSNRQKKKMMKKSSFQKSTEEFETITEKRQKKKEAFLKDKQQREEAIQKYKQKKQEKHKMLNTKTKKGQPNLNVQMDYLLKKIQESKQ